MRDALEDARRAVAEFVGARPSEVVFTGSGTEAANLAARAALSQRARPSLCSAVEHAAVRLAAERLGRVVVPRVDRAGRLDLDHLARLVIDAGDGTPPALVHCQLANHEVGTLQPVEDVARLCRDAGVVLHVDACTGLGRVPFDFAALGVDLVSLSSHKLGGPPGVGALVLRRGMRVAPLVVGGDQERARHAGFENVPGILALAAVATTLGAPGALEAEAARDRRHSEALLEAATAVEGVTPYGDTMGRVPHLVCVGVEGVEAEGVVLGLDQAGIAVHSGSACSSESFEPSPVLAAMGVAADRSLRLSVGWNTTDDDVAAFAARFPEVVGRLRALRSTEPG